MRGTLSLLGTVGAVFACDNDDYKRIYSVMVELDTRLNYGKKCQYYRNRNTLTWYVLALGDVDLTLGNVVYHGRRTKLLFFVACFFIGLIRY